MRYHSHHRFRQSFTHAISATGSLVKKSCGIENMILYAFQRFKDPPADETGDPLGIRGLTDCPAISYPPSFKGDVTVR